MSVEVAVKPVSEKTSRFHSTQLTGLDWNKIPHHIAIIPDGNRRWAKRHRSNVQEGHQEGADILLEIVKAAQELNIKVVSVYTFSTENWSRTKEEITALMIIIANYLKSQCDEMVLSGIKLETIGDLSRLPLFLKQTIQQTKEATKNCTNITLVLALNYGSRDELCRAFKSMLDDYDQKLLTKEDINEHTFEKYLDTDGYKDPELLIRTSGELRVSNFLLWQISYSEIHVSPVLWPDFTPQHLLDAILDYQERERRWGGA